MSDSQTKFYLSKAEVRRALNISPARYDQLIASEILPKPVALTIGSRPVHKPSDVETARRRRELKILTERETFRTERAASGGKKIKPISQKHLAQAKTRI